MELERLLDAGAADPRAMEEMTVGFVLGITAGQAPAHTGTPTQDAGQARSA
jgi:hypothetical protein